MIEAEQLAQAFHETYERLAPQFSYETRKASAVPWADVPENNKALMIAVAEELLTGILAEGPTIASDLREVEIPPTAEIMNRLFLALGLCPLCKGKGQLGAGAHDAYYRTRNPLDPLCPACKGTGERPQ